MKKQILNDLKKKRLRTWLFFCETCKGSWCNCRMQNVSLSKLKTIQREVMLLYFIKKSFAENPKLLRLSGPKEQFQIKWGSTYFCIGVI